MTDLILAAISAAGAWLYAVVAVAVWRAIGDRTTGGWAIAAMWTAWLAASTALFALTGIVMFLPHKTGFLGFVSMFVFGGAAGIGTYLVVTGDLPLPGPTAALWPIAGLCWLIARAAVVAGRVTARFATIAVAPARLVGRKRIGAAGRDERIAAMERELGL